MTKTTVVRPPDLALRSALQLAVLFALVRLLFQFALTLYTTHIGYSYFRDEFYYIACGRHLAWGYVDHGPIVALQARVGELIFGDSIFALRILSALAGAIAVFLTGILCWALGGRRPAQALAMLCVLLAPGYLAIDGFLSMNSCEAMFWGISLLSLILISKGYSQRLWWTIFGLSSGIGLLNKPSITFFLVCLGIGLLCTPQRRILFSVWTAVGIALTALIELPNVFWQIHNHWPTLEFLHVVSTTKNTALNPLAFFGAQLLQIHPITAFVWIAGVVALLSAKSIRNFRWIGIAYVVFLPVMWHLHAKDYYLMPFYPVLFAAGGIAWEHRFSATTSVRNNRLFAFPIFQTIAALLLLLALPMASPILQPATWVRYTTTMRFRPKDTEKDKSGALPQFYADRFGWDEMLTQTAAAYNSLSPEDRAQACIVTANYGEAASLNFLGPLRGIQLPTAITGHNNYFLWGPNGCTRKVIIAVADAPASDYLDDYRTATNFAHLDGEWIMPHEHDWVVIAHNRKQPYNWNDAKHFD